MTGADCAGNSCKDFPSADREYPLSLRDDYMDVIGRAEPGTEAENGVWNLSRESRSEGI